MSDQNTPSPAPESRPDFPPQPVQGGLEQIALDALDTAPPVNENFAARMRQEAAGQQSAAAAEYLAGEAEEPPRDRDGYLFDPDYCALDKDGQPKMTAAGRWEMKRRPRSQDKARRRYDRKKVLKKRRTRSDPPRPRLELPPDADPRLDADPVTAQAEPAQVDPLAGIPDQLDPRRTKAERLAQLIDSAFWNLSPLIADHEVVQSVQAQLSPIGQAALTDGFAEMENVPDPPWWTVAAAVYGPAVVAMIGHEKSKARRGWLRDKIAGGWLWLRGKARRVQAAPAVQEPEQRQEVA